MLSHVDTLTDTTIGLIINIICREQLAVAGGPGSQLIIREPDGGIVGISIDITEVFGGISIDITEVLLGSVLRLRTILLHFHMSVCLSRA